MVRALVEIKDLNVNQQNKVCKILHMLGNDFFFFFCYLAVSSILVKLTFICLPCVKHLFRFIFGAMILIFF